MRVIVVILLFICSVAEATHFRSGFITIRRASPGSLACEVTITVYTNTGSDIHFGSGILSFGDGEQMIPEEAPAVPRPDLGHDVAEVVFSVTHLYSMPGRFLVRYREPNRNADVINMDNSVATQFYVESLIDLTVGNSPLLQFVSPPVFKASAGKMFTAGLGVADESDYRLQYFLTTPKQDSGMVVSGYHLPAGVSVNPFNGQFTWDLESGSPPVPGDYGFAIQIDAYDLNSRFVGYAIYDFQVILLSGGPGGKISFGKDLGDKGRVFTDTEKSVKVTFEADRPDWAMTLYAELPEEAVSMTTVDSTANGKFYKVCWMEFNNILGIQRVNPYVVVVRASLLDPIGILEVNHHAYDLTALFFTTDIDFTDVITSVEKPPLDLGLFPNPFFRVLNIKGKGSGTFSLFKLTGEHVLTRTWTAGQEMDLVDLPSGFYVARVDGHAFRVVKR